MVPNFEFLWHFSHINFYIKRRMKRNLQTKLWLWKMCFILDINLLAPLLCNSQATTIAKKKSKIPIFWVFQIKIAIMEIFFLCSYKNVCILLFYIIYTLQHPYIIFLVDILLQWTLHSLLKGLLHAHILLPHISGGCLCIRHTCLPACLYVCFYRGETAMCKISIWIIEIHKSHFYKMECAMDNNKRVEIIFLIMEIFVENVEGKIRKPSQKIFVVVV